MVENNSFTRAAKQLSLTQPAVTQHIKQLENELNVKIFNRVGNEIKPTNEGNIVIEYARRCIALYQKMQQNLTDERHHIRRLTVGVTHTAESNAVAEVLGNYSAQNPGTIITIISDTINILYDMLRNYELDIAVVDGKMQDSDINSLMLDTDSLVLVVSNNNTLASKSIVTIEELKNSLILRGLHPDQKRLSHLESNNMSIDDFNVILEVDNIATIKSLVRRDIGVSILSRSACLDELQKGKLTVLPIENLSMIREINILYHKDFRHIDILQSIMKEYHNVVKYYGQ